MKKSDIFLPASITIFSCMMLLTAGCSSVTTLRVKELQEVQNRVDSLSMQLSMVQDSILEEEKKQSEILRLIRADQQVKFGEIERKVSSLAGVISESQYKLSEIDEKTREIKKRWEERARIDSLENAAQSAEIENLFEIALTDFTAGRYDIALSGFLDLAERFPESPHAEEAFYWVAECYYVRNNYTEAENRYKAYIKKYAQGSKVCVALFKLGLIYEKSGKNRSRNVVWDTLIKQCPQSEEANAAREKMK